MLDARDRSRGKQIRTVDGLANGDTLHPVQQAFCEGTR